MVDNNRENVERERGFRVGLATISLVSSKWHASLVFQYIYTEPRNWISVQERHPTSDKQTTPDTSAPQASLVRLMKINKRKGFEATPRISHPRVVNMDKVCVYHRINVIPYLERALVQIPPVMNTKSDTTSSIEYWT